MDAHKSGAKLQRVIEADVKLAKLHLLNLYKMSIFLLFNHDSEFHGNEP